jgi:hypothetical protein
MGQTNLIRTQFEPRTTIINPKNDDKQDVSDICYFELGDTVDVIDEDVNGNITSVLANNITIQAISPGNAATLFVVLSAVVDTTAAVGTPRIRVQEIDDGQSALERVFCRRQKGPFVFDLFQNINLSTLNQPIAGQTTLDVDDVSFFRVGDTVDILADEGIIVSDAVIQAVNPNADASLNQATIVINGVVDTSGFTNPFILDKTITISDAIRRNQERIDSVDRPVENEFMGLGNGTRVAWETTNLFVEGSSKPFVDGRRARRGIAGTRATHIEGAGTSQLTYTSMLLGLLGNFIDIEVVNAPGLGVTVTEQFKSSSSAIIPPTEYLVQVNSNSGTATAQEIADAINADAVAKTIVQVQYGGGGLAADGSGVVTPFGPTALTGGLDDGTADYAELEQIFENSIIGTGFKWVSLHIRPDERNRYNEPPQDDEEQCIDYRRAMENVDR